MRPYGEVTPSEGARHIRRQTDHGNGFYNRMSLDEWRNLRRKWKKRARQYAKKELEEEMTT